MSIKRGDDGDEVLAIQQALVKYGYNITADGKFGYNTETAVRRFQAQQGLKVDGVVGPRTRAALFGG